MNTIMLFLSALSGLVGVAWLIRAYVECRKQTRRNARALGVYIRRVG